MHKRSLIFLPKKPNTIAKQLNVDMEKEFPIKLNYTTVWKAKQKAMKELYGDLANTFRMLYSFKAEVEHRSPGSVVEIDTKVTADGKVFFSNDVDLPFGCPTVNY